MNIGNFRKISNKPIKPTNIVFKTYKGDSIIPLGYVTVRVQYKNQKVNLNLYIVKENLDTILGREWLYKIHLDWPAIKAFRAKTEQNLNNLLREYKDIFDDKLGEINNYEAKLKLRHGVKPIFCRVRTVPFALKGRVENENFDSFIERFETYLDVQNVPIANRAKVFVSSLSAKLYQLLKNLLAPDIPSDQTLDKLKDAHLNDFLLKILF
ncbi:retrovirus-related Pol polyprotein from transposon 412 [Trichonephila clavipes]|nr:retrovirus-related Pol polyprotein from transposon 412 [Trichonephila clavipes]